MRRSAGPIALGLIDKGFLCLALLVVFAPPLRAEEKTVYVLDVPLPKRATAVDVAANKYAVEDSFEETVGFYRSHFKGKEYVWHAPVAASGTLLQVIANPYPTSKWAYVSIVRLKGKTRIHILPRAPK
jgi:hypothetical protein